MLGNEVSRANIPDDFADLGEEAPGPKHGVTPFTVKRWYTNGMSLSWVKVTDKLIDVSRCDPRHIAQADKHAIDLMG
jgi:hypothetical protein